MPVRKEVGGRRGEGGGGCSPEGVSAPGCKLLGPCVQLPVSVSLVHSPRSVPSSSLSCLIPPQRLPPLKSLSGDKGGGFFQTGPLPSEHTTQLFMAAGTLSATAS